METWLEQKFWSNPAQPFFVTQSTLDNPKLLEVFDAVYTFRFFEEFDGYALHKQTSHKASKYACQPWTFIEKWLETQIDEAYARSRAWRANPNVRRKIAIVLIHFPKQVFQTSNKLGELFLNGRCMRGGCLINKNESSKLNRRDFGQFIEII